MLTLLKYELKKILLRPFTLVVIIGCVVSLIFINVYAVSQRTLYYWGPSVYGSYENIPKNELEYAHNNGLTGDKDGTLVLNGTKAIQYTKEITKRFEGEWNNERLAALMNEYIADNNNPDNYYENSLDTMSMQMRAWSLASEGLSTSEIEKFDKEHPIYNMKSEYLYGKRLEWMQLRPIIEAVIVDDDTVKSFSEAFPLISEPSYYEYHDGALYTTNAQEMMIGLFALIILVAALSPVFSDETTYKTREQLLCAKHGREKLVYAKLAAGLIFTMASFAALTAINLMCCGLLLGFEGWGVMVQFDTSLMPFALNYFSYMLVVLGFQALGLCSTAAIIMLLSCVLRTAIPVIFTGGILIFTSIFIDNLDQGFFLRLLQSLPFTSAMPRSIITDAYKNALNLLPISQWIFSLAVGALILIFCLAAVIIQNKKLDKR